MQIRPVDPDEIEALVDQLWVPLAEEMERVNSYHALTDDAREKVLAYKRDLVESDEARTLVAVESGTLLGYVSAEVQPSAPIFRRGDDLYVSEVYVDEDHRRGGIGSDLLDAIAAWGREKGCETASVDVDVANAAARDLYEAIGFRHTRAKYRADL